MPTSFARLTPLAKGRIVGLREAGTPVYHAWELMDNKAKLSSRITHNLMVSVRIAWLG